MKRESGDSPLPVRIRWRHVGRPQDVGQIVDGRWRLENGRLRTAQVGYDRIFLVGNRRWRDYEVRTSILVHAVAPPDEAFPYSGGHGVGLILRFSGHTTGGPFAFASGQPKFGYLPLGGIALLRWARGVPDRPPLMQFYSGDGVFRYGEFPVSSGMLLEVRGRCETLPDASGGRSMTRYSFKAWRAGGNEPAEWSWQHVLTSGTALREGGLALLAHHVDASFGDLTITNP